MIAIIGKWRRAAALLALAVTAGLFPACTTVPGTGRTQFNLLPESQLVAMADQEFEAQKQQVGVSNDTAKNAQLQRVGRAIVKAARQRLPGDRRDRLPPEDQWEFVVFASPQLNAFAMPGGKVGFYEGIWQVFDDDDDLAVVMAHEIAHVVARHGNERVSQQVGLEAISALVNQQIGQSEMSPELKQAVQLAYGFGSQVGVLAYSRTHESEADLLGLEYMAQAGYNPEAGIGLWQDMTCLSGGAGAPEWLSTHPSGETRIENIRAALPEVMPIYENNKHKTGR